MQVVDYGIGDEVHAFALFRQVRIAVALGVNRIGVGLNDRKTHTSANLQVESSVLHLIQWHAVAERTTNAVGRTLIAHVTELEAVLGGRGIGSDIVGSP